MDKFVWTHSLEKEKNFKVKVHQWVMTEEDTTVDSK